MGIDEDVAASVKDKMVGGGNGKWNGMETWTALSAVTTSTRNELRQRG